MQVFLHLLISVHLEDRRLGLDMVPIIEAVMGDIVAESSHQYGQGVEVVEPGVLYDVLRLHNKVDMLGNITAM